MDSTGNWPPVGRRWLCAALLCGGLALAGVGARAQADADFGDAPEGGAYAYATTLAYTGAYHELDASLFLGEQWDAEADGQPTFEANGDGADEDGVLWLTTLVVGGNAAIGVVAADAAYLNAWIDFDGDGTWDQANEHFINGMLLEAGTNELFFAIPSPVQSGSTYARFRLSRQVALDSFGPAPDGEVEDYKVTIEAYDFGDAFDQLNSYPTTLDQDGARHVLQPGIYLGGALDAELDAFPGDSALTDDLSGVDDEDGVLFSEPLTPGLANSLEVIASTNGYLQAWFDWSYNGNWDAGFEHVLKNVALVPGTNHLSVAIPANTPSGYTYARFRFSSQLDLGVSGPAPDGEVEDYLVAVEAEDFDYGDAPDGGAYPTLLAHNGARHRMVDGVQLGWAVDPDLDGQPSSDADGDDVDVDGNDEDGVFFLAPWLPGMTATTYASASVPGYLQAWIDFNDDGDWNDAGEQVASNVFLDVEASILSVNMPLTVSAAALIARFRFSTLPDLGVDGLAEDGEVEDYRIPLTRVDCGDAPDTSGYQYPVRLANSGASHGVDAALCLGSVVDAEPDGQPSLLAVGDDADGDGNDDDGIVWLNPLQPGQPAALRVTVKGTGHLQGWIDFGGDGIWNDLDDRIIDDRLLGAGTHVLTVSVPADAVVGLTFARFRFASSITGVGGFAPDGEVEDYAVQVKSATAPLPAGDPCAIWLQRPNGAYGIDVQSWMQPSLGPVNGRVVRVADDWPADGRPVSGCRWWGSYINWTNNPAALPASSRPTGFRLTLYADVLSTNAPFLPGPGLELTNATVTLLAYNNTNAVPGQATERLFGISQQGSFSTPGDFEYEYEYRAQFVNPWPVLAEQRYWLGVEAVVASTPTYRWGWCVASPPDGHDRNGNLRKSNESSWSAMTYPPNVFPWSTATNHPDAGQPVELSFELFSADCPRRAHQWPQWEDTFFPDGVSAWYRVGTAPDQGHLRADDFVADGRRIAGVTWQGAYAGWASGVSGSLTNPVAPPAGNGRPLGFLLAWYATNSAGCGPGVVLTNLFVPMAHCMEQYAASRAQPWEAPAVVWLHTYAYTVNLMDPRVSGEAWPGVANQGYWLSIQAVFAESFVPGGFGHTGWLWQNALHVQRCGSVRAVPTGTLWTEGEIASPNPLAGEPLDLTFDLHTDSAGFSPLYDPPEILAFDVHTNGAVDLASVGDLGSGVQVLQFSSNLPANVWLDLATNRLPRELPYTNRWPGAQPPAGTKGALRILQR